LFPSRATPAETSALPRPSQLSGITLAVGALAPFDRERVRTMLRTLATHVSAYFRLVDEIEGELSLVADAAEDVQRMPRPADRLIPLTSSNRAVWCSARKAAAWIWTWPAPATPRSCMRS